MMHNFLTTIHYLRRLLIHPSKVHSKSVANILEYPAHSPSGLDVAGHLLLAVPEIGTGMMNWFIRIVVAQPHPRVVPLINGTPHINEETWLIG